MKAFPACVLAAAGSSVFCFAAGAIIPMPTSVVANPGNGPDAESGFGAVPYVYEIGISEVTNAQYCAFLNSMASTSDPYGIWNVKMAGSEGGMKRTVVSGVSTYAPKPGREDMPANFMSFWDACRFANWLHNGQPVGLQGPGTTEDGAYTLTADGMANNTIERNADWRWAVTSENEWYKAAYHQPAASGGDFDHYWRYPNSRNTVTAVDANFDLVVNDFTPACSYPPNFYGACDMAGNLYEWHEGIVFDATQRGRRGGSFKRNEAHLRITDRDYSPPSLESGVIGFRVVRRVEPINAGGNLHQFRPRK